jgi:hypothetical protein
MYETSVHFITWKRVLLLCTRIFLINWGCVLESSLFDILRINLFKKYILFWGILFEFDNVVVLSIHVFCLLYQTHELFFLNYTCGFIWVSPWCIVISSWLSVGMSLVVWLILQKKAVAVNTMEVDFCTMHKMIVWSDILLCSVGWAGKLTFCM